MGYNPRLTGQPLGHLFPIHIGQGAARELAEITFYYISRQISSTAKAPHLFFDEFDPAIDCLVKVGLLRVKGEPKRKTTLLKLADMRLFAQAAGAGLIRGVLREFR